MAEFRGSPWWENAVAGFFIAAGGYGFYKLVEWLGQEDGEDFADDGEEE